MPSLRCLPSPHSTPPNQGQEFYLQPSSPMPLKRRKPPLSQSRVGKGGQDRLPRGGVLALHTEHWAVLPVAWDPPAALCSYLCWVTSTSLNS